MHGVVDRIRLLTGHVTAKPDDVAYLHALAGQPNLERTRRLTVPPGPLLLTRHQTSLPLPLPGLLRQWLPAEEPTWYRA